MCKYSVSYNNLLITPNEYFGLTKEITICSFTNQYCDYKHLKNCYQFAIKSLLRNLNHSFNSQILRNSIRFTNRSTHKQHRRLKSNEYLPDYSQALMNSKASAKEFPIVRIGSRHRRVYFGSNQSSMFHRECMRNSRNGLSFSIKQET